MRGIVHFLQWLQPIVTMIAMAAWLLVTILVSIVFWSIALIFGGEAIVDWESSTLRDEVVFRRERAQESAVIRTISDARRSPGRSVRLADLVGRPMRRACIEGWGAPQRIWLHGETAALRRKSYRPIRRSTSSDHGDASLAIEFTDGAILAMQVPFGRATADFGTPERFVCADGGWLVFTWQTSRLVAIRGD